MEEMNAKTLAELRRQRKKRRSTQKFVGFVIIITVILGLYVSKERWMPDFTVDNSGYTDDEISVGSFPLRVSNNTAYKTCGFGDGIAVLTDTRLYFYNSSGETDEIRDNDLSNTILKSSGSRILIYEQNGNSIRVDAKRGTLYEKSMDNSIYTAAVSSKGFSAAVTESDQYVCELHIYDNTGDEIYFRGCTERVTDVVFRNDSKGCYLVSLNVSEGHIVSEIVKVDFSDTEADWKVDNIATCPVSAYISPDNDLVLFGDSMCTMYNAAGECITEYQYPGELIDASYSGEGAVMIFENKERRSTTFSVISSEETGSVSESVTNDKFRHILAWNGCVYLLAETKIEAYGYDCKQINSAELTEPFRSFCKAGKYIFLEGHRKIEKVEF